MENRPRVKWSFLKYGQILYQKIALRVSVPTQQTARDFEFSRESYGRFRKMRRADFWVADRSAKIRIDPDLTGNFASTGLFFELTCDCWAIHIQSLRILKPTIEQV